MGAGFYKNIIFQKNVQILNGFLFFFILGFIYGDASNCFSMYFFYFPVRETILGIGAFGSLIGIAAGRGFLRFIKKPFIINTGLYLALTIFAALYLLRFYIYENDILLELFFLWQFALPILFFLISMISGTCVILSIIGCFSWDASSESDVSVSYLFSIIAGLSIGIISAWLAFLFKTDPAYFSAVMVLFVPIMVYSNIIWNLRYSQAVRETERETAGNGGSGIVSLYCVTALIGAFAYLGLLTARKFYCDMNFVVIFYLFSFLILLGTGFKIGAFVRITSAYIWIGALFPIVYISSFVFISSYGDSMGFVAGCLISALPSVFFGIALRRIIEEASAYFLFWKKVTVWHFLYIIVLLVFLGMSLVFYTKILFMIVLLAMTSVAIALPVVYMFGSEMSLKKKWAVYAAAIIVIPTMLALLRLNGIWISQEPFAPQVQNFHELKNVNYNSPNIRGRAVINMRGYPVFDLSDSFVKNLRRSIVPVSLFLSDQKKILFIDGYQRIYRNPSIAVFANFECLDYVPQSSVDFQRLPESGNQLYQCESSDLLGYLYGSAGAYGAVVDMPNLLEQRFNSFRFSSGYYSIVKSKMAREGVFAQLISVPHCRAEHLIDAISGMRRSFKKTAVFYFPRFVLVMGSDVHNAFALNQQSYNRLEKILHSSDSLQQIFVNELHALTHYIPLDSAAYGKFFMTDKRTSDRYFHGRTLSEDPFYLKSFAEDERMFLALIDRSQDEAQFAQTITSMVSSGDPLLVLLKKFEIAESFNRYSDEIAVLFELKKMAEYRMKLQEYVFPIIAYKIDYYFSIAYNYESKNIWDEARRLYGVVLDIDPESFKANYRMGIVCLTLQDMECSLKFLRKAMQLKSEDARVLYQMGVLYFSTGKTQEALEYFERALKLNEKNHQLFRYIGMCQEKLGKLNEARDSFVKALVSDPNDIDSRARLDQVKIELEKEKKKWNTAEQKNENDVELESDMPLPITRSALDVRLKDDDKSLPLLDANGNDTEAEKKTENFK